MAVGGNVYKPYSGWGADETDNLWPPVIAIDWVTERSGFNGEAKPLLVRADLKDVPVVA